jgi:hypothetical protein
LQSIITSIQAQDGALAELKTSSLHPEILTAVKASNEAHATHTATLGELKTLAAAPAEKVDLSSIESSLKTVLASIEAQNGTLSEIKTVASVSPQNSLLFPRYYPTLPEIISNQSLSSLDF